MLHLDLCLLAQFVRSFEYFGLLESFFLPVTRARRWMLRWGDDGVNWFDRANELSPVNQGLMGYPGTGNLVRELEQVRRNVRHI